MKILVAEDNAASRNLLRCNLELHGCVVIEAENGKQGFELAKINRPDLIISDALMPVMDGFRFLKKIRASEELNAIPFVFYSGFYTGEKEEKLAFSAGADAVIVKPKSLSEFWNELNALLEDCGFKFEKNSHTRTVKTDEEYFRDYSAIISSKLEEKVSELEMEIRKRRESEEQYRMLFESNPVPMWVYDLETLSFLAVNNSAIYHYGYSREEFLSMDIRDIRPREDIAALLNNVSRVAGGLDFAGVWRHLKKDGSLIFVEIISHSIDFSGKRAEIVMAQDVTERMKAEEELKERVEDLEKFYEMAVNRELKMKELKEENARLSEELAMYRSKYGRV